MAFDDPKEIRTIQKKTLLIVWADDHVSEYSYRFLRLKCPCALCVDEWTKASLLDESKVPRDLKALKVEPRGRYALSFRFSDGHDTGIYSFERLRQMCLCPICQHKSK